MYPITSSDDAVGLLEPNPQTELNPQTPLLPPDAVRDSQDLENPASDALDNSPQSQGCLDKVISCAEKTGVCFRDCMGALYDCTKDCCGMTIEGVCEALCGDATEGDIKFALFIGALSAASAAAGGLCVAAGRSDVANKLFAASALSAVVACVIPSPRIRRMVGLHF